MQFDLELNGLALIIVMIMAIDNSEKQILMMVVIITRVMIQMVVKKRCISLEIVVVIFWKMEYLTSMAGLLIV
jgi:hypothetical protein